jgi:hypothetical protein
MLSLASAICCASDELRNLTRVYPRQPFETSRLASNAMNMTNKPP